MHVLGATHGSTLAPPQKQTDRPDAWLFVRCSQVLVGGATMFMAVDGDTNIPLDFRAVVLFALVLFIMYTAWQGSYTRSRQLNAHEQ